MSMHEELITALHHELDLLGSAIALSPSSLALAVQQRFAARPIEPHLQYASLEHIKQLARTVLARRFDPDGDESQAHQGELFSGILQDHYPVPRANGQEPVYKKRDALSHEEVLWNASLLRKSANARLAHADALLAWDEGRSRRRQAA